MLHFGLEVARRQSVAEVEQALTLLDRPGLVERVEAQKGADMPCAVPALRSMGRTRVARGDGAILLRPTTTAGRT